jgi:hypothetical protein
VDQHSQREQEDALRHQYPPRVENLPNAPHDELPHETNGSTE